MYMSYIRSSAELRLTGTSGTHRWTFLVEKKKNYDRHMSKRLPMLPLSHIFPLMPLLVSGAAGLNSHEAAPCDATYQAPTSDSLTVCAMIMKRIYIGCCTFSSVLYVYGLCSHMA